ncbi:MAG: tRNA (adenine-N1)-methyltransferase [Acidimicrobiia bacterium]
MSGALQVDEVCLLIDGQGRRYLVQLSAGGELHSHLGVLPHSEVIGLEEGSRVHTSKGHQLLVLRPGLADYILKMKRGPQVVYPKDLGSIIVYADIAPGTTVIEGGTGSGALTMALLRAVGPAGQVVSVERRADHAAHAHSAILDFFGEIPANLDLRVGLVEEVVREIESDRIVLDIPEPWRVIAPAATKLRNGGVFCAYVPTVPQMQEVVEKLKSEGAFGEIISFEVLLRTWNVEDRSVRPSHQMVGHTGFIAVGRKIKES